MATGNPAIPRSAAPLALGIVGSLFGCAEPEWAPSGVGSPALAEAEQDPSGAPIALDDDLVPWAADGTDESAEVPGGTLASSDPRVFFLFYADGNPPPSTSVCKTKIPPAYTCSFGKSVEDCQKQVQTYLDKWYADFNIIFTLTKPTTGTYYTEVISTTGAWCGMSAGIGGVSPFMCKDFNGNTCYAFMCGSSAKKCAVVIAQEQAHLVGLAHTSSSKDLLYPSVCSLCDGFENKVNSAMACGSTQNSYELMKERLGAWPGGPKPGPFGMVPGGGSGGSGGAAGTGGGGGAAGGSGGGGGAGGGTGGGAGGGAGGTGGTGGGSGGGGGNGGGSPPDGGGRGRPAGQVTGGCAAGAGGLAPAGDHPIAFGVPLGLLLFRRRRCGRLERREGT